MREKEAAGWVKAKRYFQNERRGKPLSWHGGVHIDKVTTPFFLTNFPEEVSTAELCKLFARFDRVGEVFIPKKHDKLGKRFGFVKFRDVRNVEEMEKRLGDVRWEGHKLKVKKTRFGRDEKEVEVQTVSKIELARGKEAVSGYFKNTLMNKEQNDVVVRTELSTMEFQPSVEVMDELKRC